MVDLYRHFEGSYAKLSERIYGIKGILSCIMVREQGICQTTCDIIKGNIE